MVAGIGVWDAMDHSRTRPIESMQVWDGISDARIQFHSPLTQFDTVQPFTLNPPVDVMATLVENLNLQRGALRQLCTHSGVVELVDGSRVASIEEGEGGWPVVKLQNPAGEATRSLRARLLVSDIEVEVGRAGWLRVGFATRAGRRWLTLDPRLTDRCGRIQLAGKGLFQHRHLRTGL